MGVDGAAVKFGHKGGVIALLQAEPGTFIVLFHCLTHKLELAMLSVQRKNPMADQVYNLLNMWKTHHYSSKSMRELRALGQELGVRIIVSGTRWLPHVTWALQTVLRPAGPRAVCNSLLPHGSFDCFISSCRCYWKSTEDQEDDGRWDIIAFCHFIADLFGAISKSSLLLQRNHVILPQAMAIRSKPGGGLAELKADPHAQKRRQADDGDEDSTPSAKAKAVRNGCDTNLAREESMKMFIFRNNMDKSYQCLWEMMRTREPHCSDYKRILGTEEIKSDVKGSLHVDTVEDLIRTGLEGPGLEEFNAKEAVQMWFSQVKRARRPNYKGWPSEVPNSSTACVPFSFPMTARKSGTQAVEESASHADAQKHVVTWCCRAHDHAAVGAAYTSPWPRRPHSHCGNGAQDGCHTGGFSALRQEEEVWFQLYFEEAQPTSLGKKRQLEEDDASDDRFFFSGTGTPIYNASNDLERLHNKLIIIIVLSY
ncbi:hypothetical protein JZ751_021627 [Albula glossodonta]|uniref:Uncharacterized protein n=1 Tax=Albula glossodonta TaxID=121402 RepID=A0A8T2MZ45_9TELE|nr:hypothetical protein JZ751_021627 [Albula glossodonta]